MLFLNLNQYKYMKLFIFFLKANFYFFIAPIETNLAEEMSKQKKAKKPINDVEIISSR